MRIGSERISRRKEKKSILRNMKWLSCFYCVFLYNTICISVYPKFKKNGWRRHNLVADADVYTQFRVKLRIKCRSSTISNVPKYSFNDSLISIFFVSFFWFSFPVESLVYWRDVQKSGVVFGAGLALLLAISLFSVISVIAYASLIVLLGTVSFRVYKIVLQTIQKTSDGHPFK